MSSSSLPPSTSPPLPPPAEIARLVEQLVGMGFDKKQSHIALHTHQYHLGRALDWLLSGAAPPSLSPPPPVATPTPPPPSAAAAAFTRRRAPPLSSASHSPYLRPSSSSLLSMSSLPPPTFPPHSPQARPPSPSLPSPSPSPSSTPSSSSSTPSSLYHGTINSVNPDKAFAWIRCPSFHPSHHIFVHQSSTLHHQLLHEGDEVTFTVGPNPRDPTKTMAENVEVVVFADPATKGEKWRHKWPGGGGWGGGGGGGGGGWSERKAGGLAPSPGSGGAQASTAEYLGTLPRYGRVERVQAGAVGVVATFPLLAGEVGEGLGVDLSGVTGARVGALVTFHHLFPRPPSDLFVLSPSSLPSFPSSTCNLSHTLTTTLLIRQPLTIDEDRHTEFKSLLMNHHVEERVGFLVEKNVSAFLNSEGGWLYVGVDDAGVVEGLWLDKRRRDELKRRVDSVMHGMSPAVDTSLYSLHYLPVHLALDPPSPPSSLPPNPVDLPTPIRAIALPDLYVLVLRVERPEVVSCVYFTSGRYRDMYDNTGGQKAWLRRDGSVREMNAAMVNERLKGVVSRKEEQMKAEMIREVLHALQERKEPHALIPPSSSSSPSPSPSVAPAERAEEDEEVKAERDGAAAEDAVVGQLVLMGVERAVAVSMVSEVVREGRLKRGTVNIERLISDIFDRLSLAQQRGGGGKEENVAPAAGAAPPSPPLPPVVGSTASMYPSLGLGVGGEEVAAVYSGGGVVRQAVRAGEGYGDEVVGDESFPCQFCKCSYRGSYLMEHQRRCEQRRRVRNGTAATQCPPARQMHDLTGS